MKRQDFIKLSSLAGISFFIPSSFANAVKITDENNSKLKPNRLKAGDKVRLVSPAGFITEKNLSDSILKLESLGFNVDYGKNVLNKFGYLAGTDEERANDINDAFADKSVKGIICTRGGYGCARMLHLIDYDLVKNNPKVVCGYSDITSLLFALYKKSGLVCFHGPVSISNFEGYSRKSFSSIIMEKIFNEPQYPSTEDKLLPEYESFVINSGIAEGELFGGNLSLVVSMLSTPYDIDYKNKILFLEDVGEEPYRVDRMLTQLLLSGKLNELSGIILGIFTDNEPNEKKSGIGNSFSLNEILFDRLSNLDIPVIYGLSFGHVRDKLTLPFGINARMDTFSKSLTLLEPAVV